jgi:N-acetylmuramic acid 6-phosphate etherase
LRSSRNRKLRQTEQQNPRSLGLDQLTTQELVRLIQREDATVARAVAREADAIARAIVLIVAALRSGGRLIYVGAGTSGRIAAVDAAECPPTFGVPSTQVHALMAGGTRAFTKAIEGVEDSATQGAHDLTAIRVARRDVVVGISSGGTTPYVLAALRLARKQGALTIGLTANRKSGISKVVDVLIAPETGAELIAGSTRMKAGTAQKMVLNTLSTGTFVALGRVYNNWMVDVALANRKLRERGLRILQEATGATARQASRALAKSGSNMRVALIMLKTGIDAAGAKRKLKENRGDLRLALGEGARRRN